MIDKKTIDFHRELIIKNINNKSKMDVTAQVGYNYFRSF